jgi:UDP-glucose 4-epimerase
VGEVVNIGSAEEVSIQELAALLLALSGSRAGLQFVPAGALYGPGYEDIPRRVPSLVKMQRLLGVVAQVPLAEGLRRTLAWFQQEARSVPRATQRRPILERAEKGDCQVSHESS